MVLFFISMNLGACIANLKPDPARQVAVVAFAHFGAIIVFSLLIILAPRLKVKLPDSLRLILKRLLCALLLAAAFIALAGHMEYSFSFSPILPIWLSSTCLSLFWTLSLYLFICNVPHGRQGLSFGISMAVGELVWLLVLPLMRIVSTQALDPAQVIHMHKLQGA